MTGAEPDVTFGDVMQKLELNADIERLTQPGLLETKRNVIEGVAKHSSIRLPMRERGRIEKCLHHYLLSS